MQTSNRRPMTYPVIHDGEPVPDHLKCPDPDLQAPEPFFAQPDPYYGSYNTLGADPGSMSPSQFTPSAWKDTIASTEVPGYTTTTIKYAAFCKDQVSLQQERRQELRANQTFEHVEKTLSGRFQLVSENPVDGSLVSDLSPAFDLTLIRIGTNREAVQPLYALQANGQFHYFPVENDNLQAAMLRKELRSFGCGYRERRNHYKEDSEKLLGALLKTARTSWLPFFYGWNISQNSEFIYVIPGDEVYQKHLKNPASYSIRSEFFSVNTLLNQEYSMSDLKLFILTSAIINRALLNHQRVMLDTPLLWLLKNSTEAKTLSDICFWESTRIDSDAKPLTVKKLLGNSADGIYLELRNRSNYDLTSKIDLLHNQMQTVATEPGHSVFPLIWSRDTLPTNYQDDYIPIVVDIEGTRISSMLVHSLVPDSADLSLVFDLTDRLLAEKKYTPFGKFLIGAIACCYPKLKALSRLNLYDKMIRLAETDVWGTPTTQVAIPQ